MNDDAHHARPRCRPSLNSRTLRGLHGQPFQPSSKLSLHRPSRALGRGHNTQQSATMNHTMSGMRKSRKDMLQAGTCSGGRPSQPPETILRPQTTAVALIHLTAALYQCRQTAPIVFRPLGETGIPRVVSNRRLAGRLQLQDMVNWLIPMNLRQPHLNLAPAVASRLALITLPTLHDETAEKHLRPCEHEFA